jgi:hypothetical protein
MRLYQGRRSSPAHPRVRAIHDAAMVTEAARASSPESVGDAPI